MASRFTARRRARTGILVAFLRSLLPPALRAQETAEPAKPAPSQPAASRPAQGARGPEGRRARPGPKPRRRPPSSTGCRRTPRPSTRWRFPAAPCHSRPPPDRSACSTTRARRSPTSPTPPISSMAPTAPAPRDVPVQRRARRVIGLAATRRCRPMAAVDHRRGRGCLRLARPAAECRDLARFHRSRLHRSRRHRLQPLCRDWR